MSSSESQLSHFENSINRTESNTPSTSISEDQLHQIQQQKEQEQREDEEGEQKMRIKNAKQQQNHHHQQIGNASHEVGKHATQNNNMQDQYIDSFQNSVSHPVSQIEKDSSITEKDATRFVNPETHQSAVPNHASTANDQMHESNLRQISGANVEDFNTHVKIPVSSGNDYSRNYNTSTNNEMCNMHKTNTATSKADSQSAGRLVESSSETTLQLNQYEQSGQSKTNGNQLEKKEEEEEEEKKEEEEPLRNQNNKLADNAVLIPDEKTFHNENSLDSLISGESTIQSNTLALQSRDDLKDLGAPNRFQSSASSIAPVNGAYYKSTNSSEADIFKTPVQTPEMEPSNQFETISVGIAKEKPKSPITPVDQITSSTLAQGFSSNNGSKTNLNLGARNSNTSRQTTPKNASVNASANVSTSTSVEQFQFKPPQMHSQSLLASQANNQMQQHQQQQQPRNSPDNINKRKSQASLPEPNIDNESFVDQYLYNSPPVLVSYQLNELIMTHNEPTPTQQKLLETTPVSTPQLLRHSNQESNITEQVVHANDDRLLEFLPSPTRSTPQTPRSSRYFDIDSNTIDKFVNDTQAEVPPRGDVKVVTNKQKRNFHHHRQGSSVTSAGEISNSLRKSLENNSNNENSNHSSTNEAVTSTPVQDHNSSKDEDLSILPPPPPIEKSPNMRVKGRSKKSKKEGTFNGNGSVSDLSIATSSIGVPTSVSTPTHDVGVANVGNRNKDTSNTNANANTNTNTNFISSTPRPAPPRPTGSFANAATDVENCSRKENFAQQTFKSLLLDDNDANTKTGHVAHSVPNKQLNKMPSLPNIKTRLAKKQPPPSNLSSQPSSTPPQPAHPPQAVPQQRSALQSPKKNSTLRQASASTANSAPPSAPQFQQLSTRKTLSGNSNFISFFKKFAPVKDKSHMEKSSSTLSFNSSDSYMSNKSNKSQLHLHLQQQLQTSTTGSKFGILGRFIRGGDHLNSNLSNNQNHEQQNRMSVISDVAPSLKLGTLPDFDFEPEEDAGFLDDMMLTFDEKFESELIASQPRKDLVNLTTSSTSDPFMKDDELTRAQIVDQQLMDEEDDSGGANSDDSTDHTKNVNANEGTGTMGSYYMDENIEYLRNNYVWPTLEDVTEEKEPVNREHEATQTDDKIESQNEIRDGNVAGTTSPTTVDTSTRISDDNDISTVKSPAQQLEDQDADSFKEGDETFISLDYQNNESNERGLTSPIADKVLSSSSTSALPIPSAPRTIVIESDELEYIVNNLSDEEKRNLPPHLKYIKQFVDFRSITVEFNKFQDLENAPLPTSTDARNKSTSSILRRRKTLGRQGSIIGLGRSKLNGSGNNSNKTKSKKRSSGALVSFTDRIVINETFSGDVYKRYNKSVTQYSLSDPREINRIKNEVNWYKCNEMLVHELSQDNTHFFY
ncbi:hypothetical protein LELG_02406 [Lodderomyces elongisporus NRRL YB-4239]|uniref:Uncharacterized protein n=1 Tax=Lodderomyces elongisporus (strain ATCC 11503 / CBS 2605 / JCM 1781 / NBRC 1676 / NRRL YB-4239) TaxID=379508 RepID=A5DYG9_LODEL|nr:hypothetical protein LELG_02406 [Lodderomyces elongisporus NRRL YB-4239]